MTETDSAVTEAGRFVMENTKMDVSKKIKRNLVPARPLRRLNINQVHQSYAEINPVEMPDNIIKVENFYKILYPQSTSTQPPEKKVERICYTRDFLLKMASCPMAKKRPDFLPDHPIILENGRTNDVSRCYFTTTTNNNNNNKDDNDYLDD